MRARPTLAGIALAMSAGALGLHPATLAGEDRIRVMSTTGQVGDLVRNVGGDRVVGRSLMGPGIDPHLYKASEGDVIDLIDSDVVFFNGLHLEGKLGEVLEQLGERRPVHAVTDEIPSARLLTPEDYEGNADPHVWFDPTLWGSCAARVAAVLASLDTGHEATYREHAERHQAEIADFHTWAMETLGAIPDQQRVLVTAHDAFGYFGRAYGIEVVGLQGISTSTEAGVRDVQRIADLLEERRIPTIFVETSVPRRTIEAVQVAARDRGWEVSIGEPLFSDALGDSDTPEGTYLGMFRYNVQTIVNGLTGRTS